MLHKLHPMAMASRTAYYYQSAMITIFPNVLCKSVYYLQFININKKKGDQQQSNSKLKEKEEENRKKRVAVSI